MELLFIGFDAKKVVKRAGWLDVAGVEQVCSVSGCISPGPEYAFEAWKHNGLCLYDEVAVLADLLVHEDDPADFDMFAYRLLPRAFAPEGERVLAELPDLAGPAPRDGSIPANFEKLGYDCVQTGWEHSIAGFGCSPLSCNGMAAEIAVNRHCLIDGLDDAITVARLFAKRQPEPGTYCVVEVWRKRRDQGGA